ncbi:MAG: 30S ribosomal protein S16 [Candidatus Eisenbacteria bacterium]|nr:30S ribosomal protein S16 [Candidatus Eisenbacteria bacterium]
MSTKIRLARHGRKKRPFYRIVVTDSRNARDGRFVEVLGSYNPIHNPAKVQVNQEKAFRWLGDGAEMSGTVENIFARAGVLSRYQSARSGEELREEERKVTIEIFGHPLDEHGSKRKGKKDAPSGPSEEAPVAVAEEPVAEAAAEEPAAGIEAEAVPPEEGAEPGEEVKE